MVSQKSKKNTAPKQRPRFPKGAGPGRAGKFTTQANLDAYLNELKIREREAKRAAAREKKNANLRETRAQARAARIARMVPNVGEVRDQITGWGSTSTSRLREHSVYHWHGVFKVRGGLEAMGKAQKRANSSRRKPKKTGDDDYELDLMPWFGDWTPKEFEAEVDAQVKQMIEEFESDGVKVEYLGAFYAGPVGEDA